MDILVGIIALVIGIAVCLMGLRLFFVLLPIWGFVTGFLVGGAAITAIAGDGFLSTTLGIIVGIAVGIVFAALSYLYWYIGVLFAAGVFGFAIGISLFASFGVDNDWVLWIVGIIGAALFIFASLVLDLPVYLVIVNTAFAGAVIGLGGLLLVLDKADRKEFGTGAEWTKINDNLILWVILIAAAVVGIFVQMQSMQRAELLANKWTKVPSFSAT